MKILNEDNHIIVGVVGTQNTGKSTFIKDVCEATKSRIKEENRFTTVGVDYRKKIEEMGLQINRNGNLQSQQVIFDCLVQSIDIAVGSPNKNRIILDRTPIDAYIYTYWLKNYKDVDVDAETLGTMYNKMMYYSKMIDAIVYIPLRKCENVTVVDDKFRDTNPEYRQQIDYLFDSTLTQIKKLKPSVDIIEIYGTRDFRVSQFLDWEYGKCLVDGPSEEIIGG